MPSTHACRLEIPRRCFLHGVLLFVTAVCAIALLAMQLAVAAAVQAGYRRLPVTAVTFFLCPIGLARVGLATGQLDNAVIVSFVHTLRRTKFLHTTVSFLHPQEVCLLRMRGSVTSGRKHANFRDFSFMPTIFYLTNRE